MAPRFPCCATSTAGRTEPCDERDMAGPGPGPVPAGGARIGGRAVPCLSAEQQVYFHQGYEPIGRDRKDMAHLRKAFGIATHF